MPKITDIKEQRRKGRFNVDVDGKFRFALAAEILVKAGLLLGQEISEEEIKRLQQKDIKNKLYNLALRFLSYRPRSEKEIRDYLLKKIRKIHGHRVASWQIGANSGDRKTVEPIIDKLKLQDLANDAEFARWWLNQRQSFRPKGAFILKQELRQKGVDNSLIAQLIDDLITPEAEQKMARKLVGERLKTLKRLSFWELRQKLFQFLAYRGFANTTIKLTLDEVLTKK